MTRVSPVYQISAKAVFWYGVAVSLAAAAQTLFYVGWWS